MAGGGGGGCCWQVNESPGPRYCEKIERKTFSEGLFLGLTRSWRGPLDKKKQPRSIRPLVHMPKHPSLPAAPPHRHGMRAPLGFVSVTGAERGAQRESRAAALDYRELFLLCEKLGPRSYKAMTDKVSSKHDLAASGATDGPSDRAGGWTAARFSVWTS